MILFSYHNWMEGTTIPSNMSVALNFCGLFNLEPPNTVSLCPEETQYAPNTANLQHNSFIGTNRATVFNVRTLPPNRANGVAVLDGSSIGYNIALYGRHCLLNMVGYQY